MSLFAISALFIAVPLIAQMRGASPIGVMLAGAAIFSLHLAAVYVAFFVMPFASSGWLRGVLTGVPADASFGTMPPLILMAMGQTVRRTCLAFFALAAIFWMLRRWTVPSHSKWTTILIWTVILSAAGLFIYAGALSMVNAVPSFEFPTAASSGSPYRTIVIGLFLVQWLAIIGLVVIACLSALKRRRSNAG